MERILKTPLQVKEQLERWFLLHTRRERTEFTGQESFTLFDLLPEERKLSLLATLKLAKHELPILILTIDVVACIINTTERFILVDENHTEFINYCDALNLDANLEPLRY